MVKEMDTSDTFGMEEMAGGRYCPDSTTRSDNRVDLTTPSTTTTPSGASRDNDHTLPTAAPTTSLHAASKKKLTDLPQKLMDSTVKMMLPEILSHSPSEEHSILALHIDGTESFEAAYSLYCTGFRLPNATVQWVEGVLAKEWGLRLIVDVAPPYPMPGRKSRSTHNSLLKNFRTVALEMKLDLDHIICKRLYYYGATVKFHIKFRHGR